MICEHRNKTNFAVSKHSVQHEYCPDCGWHKYNGKEYTKQEWNRAFVEEYADGVIEALSNPQL